MKIRFLAALFASVNLFAQAPVGLDRAAQLQRGREQFSAGELAAAQTTFLSVASAFPDDAEAKIFLAKIADEQSRLGSLRRERTSRELIGEVGQAWDRPSATTEKATVPAPAETGVMPLAAKLANIQLPSVSFNQLELGRVLAALSEASRDFDAGSATPRGVNLVLLDPTNKNPKLTLTLREVSLKRALDFITESVGYQYEVQSDAVVVRPAGEVGVLDTAFFPVTRSTVIRMSGASGHKKSSEKSADAPVDETSALRAFLQQAGVSFDLPGASLAYDGAAIIVTQTPRNLERVRTLLRRYEDVRQVEIEAKFMEVRDGALEELGVQWKVANSGKNPQTYQSNNRSLADAFANTTSTSSVIIDGSSVANLAPPSLPGAVALGNTATPFASVVGMIGEFNVNAVVRALSQKQGTDLLSSPKVTVLSGHPATITVAQEMRYPQSYSPIQSQVGTASAGALSGGGSAGVTVTAGTPQDFTSRNIGVELKVTPTVEEDDRSISLDLNPKVTEFEGFVEYGGTSVAISGGRTVTVPPGFYQPIFSVREVSTRVTIWDGATLVLGGLTREEVKKVRDKVPILGDIPLLGRAFRSKGESTQKKNLLIFVTANLVSPGGAPRRQASKGAAAGSVFQNATFMTPAGAEPQEKTPNPKTPNPK